MSEPSTPGHQELGDAPPGSPIKVEWDFFRRELPRLLADKEPAIGSESHRSRIAEAAGKLNFSEIGGQSRCFEFDRQHGWTKQECSSD